MQKNPITKFGAEKLTAELNRLKKEERPKITQAIADAREHGDLKENAEYHAAREQQGMVEARIAQLEGVLGNAQIIDVTSLNPQGKVVFGATVKLLNIDNDAEVVYQIVGNEESDLKENKISINSPIARALIGKEEGDDILVQAPAGEIEYEILEVSYI